jgi:hypothetical protein
MALLQPCGECWLEHGERRMICGVHYLDVVEVVRKRREVERVHSTGRHSHPGSPFLEVGPRRTQARGIAAQKNKSK